MKKALKKILFVTSEFAPYSKVGGLADVAGSLPGALRRAGGDVRVITPVYGDTLEKVNKSGVKTHRISQRLEIDLGGFRAVCTLHRAKVDDVIVWFLDCPQFFSDKIYPDYVDPWTVRPFVLLCFAALELHNVVSWKPDVFHCHDWPTAPLPMALAWHKRYAAEHAGAESVLTIHNLAFQGVFTPQDFVDELGFDRSGFNMDGFEFYGNVNLLKGAIVAATAVTTVSPNYAEEIKTATGGNLLDGVLRSHSEKLWGILNGLDTRYWNPAEDKYLPARYSVGNLTNKLKCRAELLKQCGWEDDGRPLMTCVSRLTTQKGFDIILKAVPELAASGVRCLFLGSGERNIEEGLTFAQSVHANDMHFFKGYNEELSHLLYAGGDMFLMPSLFEPCGLSQMIAMRYGAVPIVRSVGGLADTVFDGVNGFVFTDFSPLALTDAVSRAKACFGAKDKWRKLINNGMTADFTWNKSAERYMRVYSGDKERI